MNERTLHQADDANDLDASLVETTDAASDLDPASLQEAEGKVQDEREPHVDTEDTDGGGEEQKQSRSHDVEDSEVQTVVEAVLFASDSPIPPAKIATIAELPPRRVKKAVQQLNEHYAERGRAFRIEEIAGGYQMMTLPEYHDVLRRLFNVKKDSRLSQAAMETLAIVAYRQPILRADIEAIRGVASGEVLRGLLERQLVKIVGRAEVIGRPMLYGTSKRFLEVFGLNSLDDLPRVEELRSGAEEQPKTTPENQEGDVKAEEAKPSTNDQTESQSAMAEYPNNESEELHDDEDMIDDVDLPEDEKFEDDFEDDDFDEDFDDEFEEEFDDDEDDEEFEDEED